MRIIVGFVIIATFVLLGAYLTTRNKRYLQTCKQLLVYAAWLAVIMLLFYLISRVFR